MPKKGMKNFILSFILSLLAVIAVNKAVFFTPHKKNSITLKENSQIINGKKVRSISLFSNNGKDQPTINGILSDFTAPKKQIADVSELDNLTADIKADISQSDNTSSPLDNLPATASAPLRALETDNSLISQPADVQTMHAKQSETKTKVSKTAKIDIGLNNAQEIVLEQIEASSDENSTENLEKSGIVYADISDTLVDEKIQNADAQTDGFDNKVIYSAQESIENPSHSGTIKLAQSDDGLEDSQYSLSVSRPAEDEAKIIVKQNSDIEATNDSPQNLDSPSGKIIIAQNDLKLSDKKTLEDSEEIPLIENMQAMHESVDVLHSADASQVAMLEPNHFISDIEEAEQPEEQSIAETDLKQNEWVQMSEKSEDSPWVLAKGNKFAKNRSVVEHFAEVEIKEAEAKEAQEALNLQPADTSEKETQVAYKMIQNLLIPIPEDIMNDGDLTPQLSATPSDKPHEKAKTAETEKKAVKKTAELKDSEKQSGLFKSIATWFSGEANDNKKTAGKKSKNRTSKGGISFFGGSDDVDESQQPAQIMPAELRLSFQPNRAEISGQTLRWIHAFADNARDNDNIYIEVRIDGTSSFALQQKRLNLLSTILANRGVDFRKINIVFTSREPNSFIIRNIRFNNDAEVVVNKNSNNSYYRPW